MYVMDGVVKAWSFEQSGEGRGGLIPTLLPRFLVLLIVSSVVLAVIGPLGQVVFIVLAIHALRGAKQSVEALGLLSILLLGSRAIYPDGVGLFRWVIIFCAFGRVVWDSVVNPEISPVPRRLLGVLSLLSVWVLVGAYLVSPVPVLTILKLISFVVGVIAIVVSFYRTYDLIPYWYSWFFTMFVFSLLGSIVVAPMGLGYLRTAQGFQGIFQHPMTFGPLAASIAAWMAGLYLVCKRDGLWRFLGLSCLACLFVYASLSRTAALALGSGFLLALIASIFRRDVKRPLEFLFSSKILIILGFLVSAGVLFAPQLSQAIQDFIAKDGVQGDAAELFEESRGALVARSMVNFRASPLMGIGFGVPSDLRRLDQHLEKIAGIPVSASSEKGFMPSAVLEEIGIGGAMITIWLLILLIRPVVHWGGFPAIWLLFTSILVNVGQAIFYSIGGPGYFLWLMIGLCYARACWGKKNMLMHFYGKRPEVDNCALRWR
ncbi:MAG: O-antigen ligase domain-containing protein [Gammaproteobacteria bacterium]|nr:MAG: O-antigen ligase domain-containing protein [Gammaproteobacteria bacterium]